MNLVKWIVIVLAAYFLGCFQTGVFVSRAQNVDIRQHGSKSTGTTNMFRVLGAKASALTFAGDFLKGVLACLIGKLLILRSECDCISHALLGRRNRKSLVYVKELTISNILA